MESRRRPSLVLVQTFTEVDGQYGKTQVWIERCTAFVNIEPFRGRENFTAAERESIVTHTIRGDYYDLIGVEATDRIIFSPGMDYGLSPTVIPDDAQVFQVLAVMPDYIGLNDVVLKVEQEGRTYGEIVG
jgi:head-tail adaptor